jgi:triacylglycerol lipase
MRDGDDMDFARIRQRIAALGAALDPQVRTPTLDLFAPLHPSPPYRGVTVAGDIAYGPHPRHRLDVYRCDPMPAGARPVLLYVHGGGFTGGDKKMPGQPLYDNVALWALRNGMVGVNMTYRLAPEHRWPAGAEDVAAAVAWVRANIAGHGGDPARIFLMGHSAGAVHAASYAGRPEFHATDGHGLAGAIFVSGLYAFAGVEPNPILESYYGADGKCYGDMSSVPQISAVDFPAMVAVAEFDPPEFQHQALAVIGALTKRDGTVPRIARLGGHSHYSEIMSFGTDYEPELARQIRDFIERDCGAILR